MHTITNMGLRRVLVIDDNPTIHDDIRKILCPVKPASDLLDAEAKLFGVEVKVEPGYGGPGFSVDSAYQGQEGLVLVENAVANSSPYMLAFVDVRMPPGWDGIETARNLWKVCPELQIVICTAFSDHSWEEIVLTLGHSDRFVILKKPFDNIEVIQLAHALSQKWEMTRQAGMKLTDLNRMVAEQTAQIMSSNELLRAEVRRREQSELELRRSEHRFELAFKSSAIPMAMMHAASRTYIEVNESFTRLTGRSREEIVGQTSNEMGLLVRPEDCDDGMAALRKHGRVRDFAIRILPKAGEPREVLVSLEPVVLVEEACVLVALMDVTEQRKIEAQLRQSQKMDAIGQLAAGVAHDFNNLLTIIHGHASLQMARPSHDPQTNHSLTQIKAASERASKLTKQLLAFSRKQIMQLRPLCLNDSIERSHGLLKRLLGETVSLVCEYSPNLPTVIADDSSVDQVLLNLAVNARDAMPEGGSLRISTTVVEVSAADMNRHPEARAGTFVRLSVVDNGSGMDTTVRARIFEPFYTTKPQGKGTGLGLSTVYGIVKQHGGWLEVESAIGMGSKFHVFLAVTGEAAEARTDTTFFKAEAATKSGETILVVEDEMMLREFVTAVLADQGYTVLEAGDGLEALKVARESAGKIDLLLTDMVMPNGISGKMLATQITSQRAEMKVLFMSGYSPELVGDPSSLVPGVNFLAKPFDVAKLLKTVRLCFLADGTKARSVEPVTAVV